jgi:hypothetical protein
LLHRALYLLSTASFTYSDKPGWQTYRVGKYCK